MEEFKVFSKCPYCWHTNNNKLKKSPYPQLVVCDIDEGGCDKAYAIEIEVNIKANSFMVGAGTAPEESFRPYFTVKKITEK